MNIICNQFIQTNQTLLKLATFNSISEVFLYEIPHEEKMTLSMSRKVGLFEATLP